jgi:hypothetical protein
LSRLRLFIVSLVVREKICGGMAESFRHKRHFRHLRN